MNLNTACIHILSQLTSLVEELTEYQYTKPSATLSQSTIGQHMRHTLEFFICFEQGFDRGVINYDKRAHDKLVETDKFIALNTLRRITVFVNSLKNEKPLKLEVGYDTNSDNVITIDTTAKRELVYNIEHAVHHMAIMKIGVHEVAPNTTLPSDFGIAASTIRYKETTAQAAHH